MTELEGKAGASAELKRKETEAEAEKAKAIKEAKKASADSSKDFLDNIQAFKVE